MINLIVYREMSISSTRYEHLYLMKKMGVLKYIIFSFLIMMCLSLPGLANENESYFAKYDSDTGILSIPNVGINIGTNGYRDEEIYYENMTFDFANEGIIAGHDYYKGSTKLLLKKDQQWEVVDIGKIIPETALFLLIADHIPRYYKNYNYDFKSGILSMALVEVNNTTFYRDVKIRLDSQWSLLNLEEEHCNFTLQKVSELRACMTLDEIESIVGCSGLLHRKTGVFDWDGDDYYIWKDLSVTLARGRLKPYRAISISSPKYQLSISSSLENCS